jgi:anti-sigma factor RsiW
MTTPHIDDDLLQRYFDGDLPDEESERVRQAVASSEDEQARLARLERLRGLVRMAATEPSHQVAPDDLFARVHSQVTAERRRAGIRAIEGGRGRAAAVVGGLGLALAAAVTLAVLQPWQAAPVEDDPVARIPKRETRTALAEVTEPPRGRLGSEVLEVDFGRNTGTVFEVQGAAGQPLAVVWINDDEGMLP